MLTYRKDIFMQDFVHLHVHTQYSLLDGQASVSRLVDKAMKDGMKGIAVTDHGNMFGIKEFTNYVNKKNGGPKGEIKDLKKRIAGIETEEEKDEMLEELIDRFGEPPKSVLSLLRVARLKALAHAVYITEIKQTGSLIKLTMFERARINPEKIPELIARYKSSLKFNMAENPYFTFDLKNGSVAKKRDVLDVVEELISQMRKELITAE